MYNPILMYIPKSIVDGQRKFHTKTSPYSDNWLSLQGPFNHGTQCYYITPRGAQLLIDGSLPIACQIDHWIGLKIKQLDKQINALCTKQPIYTFFTHLRSLPQSTIYPFSIKSLIVQNATVLILLMIILIQAFIIALII